MDESRTNVLDARAVHAALVFVLRACPAAKPSDPLGVVVLDGNRLTACDGVSHHSARLTDIVSPVPRKVTRVSLDSLATVLGATIKAAKKTAKATGNEADGVVGIAWIGLSVTTTFRDELSHYTLVEVPGGPGIERWSAPPPVATTVAPPIDGGRLTAACWPGEAATTVRGDGAGRVTIEHRGDDGELLGRAVVSVDGGNGQMALDGVA